MRTLLTRCGAGVLSAGLFVGAAAAQSAYPAYPAYPQPPGGVVAASAALTVRLPADAVLLVDGKAVDGEGAVRTVRTDTIPLGREVKVSVVASARPKDDTDHAAVPPQGVKPVPVKPPAAVVKTVTLRPFDLVEVDLTSK